MQLAMILSEFKRLFDDHQLPIVLYALRQDPLVWQEIEKDDFFSKAEEYCGSRVELWNPATLSLLAMDHPIPLDSLTQQPLMSIDTKLRQQAARAYEETIRNPQSLPTLSKVGLLALALRERRRVKNTWVGISAELPWNIPNANASWISILGCLVGMLPQDDNLLQNLLPDPSSDNYPDAVYAVEHAVLCQPTTTEDQVKVLSLVAGNLDAKAQLVWVNALYRHGLPDLACAIAAHWVASTKPLTAKKTIVDIQQYQEKAALNAAAGDTKTAVELLTSAFESLCSLQAEITSQLSHTAYQDHDLLTAVHAGQQTIELSDASLRSAFSPFYAKLLAETGHADEAKKYLSQELTTPNGLLDSATVYQLEGDILSAQKNTRRVWEEFHNAPLTDNPTSWLSMIDQMVSIGLREEARSACQTACNRFPAYRALWIRKSSLNEDAGKITCAISAAELAVALNPADLDFRRKLAEMYAQQGVWEKELNERQAILAQADSSSIADSLAVAASALHANQPELAETISQKILQSDPENGLAHAYLGQAYQCDGDTSLALQHLTQATLLIPEHPQPWLALSEIQQESGDHVKALETLRAAALAAPDSPQIQLSLGKLYLSREAPSQAITYLRQAAALRPTDLKTSLYLGKTLQALGHTEEACAVLAKARQAEPLNPDLAYQHALALIANNDKSSALPVLSVVLNTDPKEVNPYILYARTVLEILGGYQPSRITINANQSLLLDNEVTQEAIKNIRKALDIEPEDVESRLLLADTLVIGGNAQEALEEYLRLGNTVAQSDPDRAWRVQFGVGCAALAIGQMDTALASLHEAVQNRPDNLLAQQTLVQAYEASHLPDEALQTARKAVQLAPHDIDNLLWFANTAERLNSPVDAIETLHRAEQLAPDHPELLLSISRYQTEIGDIEAASKTLSRMLTIDSATPQDLHRAAKGFINIKQYAGATTALTQAIQLSSVPSAELYSDLSSVQEESEDYQSALEAIQKAEEISPQETGFYLRQSDVLSKMGRHQAALACLQHALQLQQSDLASARGNKSAQNVQNAHAIFMRMSGLDVAVGDFTHALQHALDAHHANPNDLPTRCAAADLAMDMLETDLASDLTASTFSTEEAWTDATIDLIALRIDIALEKHNLSEADAILKSLSEENQQDLRFRLDKARLLIARGEISEANEIYQQVSGDLPSLAATYLENRSIRLLTEAAAVLTGLFRWNEAFGLLQQLTTLPNPNPRSLMCLCQAMIEASLALPICKTVEASAHAPDPTILDTPHHQLFQQTILKLQALTASPEIQRCQMVGELAYGASPFQADQVLGKTTTSIEKSALIFSYHQHEDLQSAQSIADTGLDDSRVLLTWALSQGQIRSDETINAIQRAVEMMPTHPLVQAAYALVPSIEHDSSVQILAWETALSIWPNEPDWHIHAAQLYHEHGFEVDAIRQYQNANELEPQNPEIILALSNLYLARGDCSKVVKMLEPLSRSADANVDIWYTLARGYSNQGKFGEATRCVEEALAINPDDCLSLLLSGTLALAQGNSDLAQARAKNVLASDPQNTGAVQLVIQTQVAAGEYDQALYTIETSLTRVHDPRPILTEKIRIIQQTKGTQSAVSLLEDAVRQYPEDSSLLTLLAEAYAQLGQREQAAKIAQAALQLKPDDPTLHLLLGRLQRKTGQLDQAIFHLGEAIRETPGSIEPYLELGRAYQERREYLQAIQIYKQAIQIMPRDSRPYYQAGLLLRENKDYQAAENMLRKASDLAPEDVNIRRQLGAIIALNLVYHPQETGHSA